MKRISSIGTTFTFLYLLLLSLLTDSSFAKKEEAQTLAINAVKKTVPVCQECVFFAVPVQSHLFRLNNLFFVATLDLIPPPFWTVGISKKEKIYILDSRDVSAWNEMIKEEKIFLKSNEDLEKFAKTFLELAVGRALYIDKLMAGEINRIQKKTKTNPNSSMEIVKDKNTFSISFYGKDLGGMLQKWDLKVDPSGTILKSQVTEF